MLVDHQGHQLKLLTGRAVFLPTTGALVLSDVHLGKAATFRARGLPVPDGDDARDLERITTLLSTTGALRLVIAGDLFHSPRGPVPDLRDWLERLEVPVTLVLGNHDRHPQVNELPLESVPSLALGGLRIVHDPSDADPGHFSLCGHLHPVVRLRESRRSTLRLPCFQLAPRSLILPAFGSFTGGHPVKPGPEDRIFVASGEQVVDATALC